MHCHKKAIITPTKFLKKHKMKTVYREMKEALRNESRIKRNNSNEESISEDQLAKETNMQRRQ